MEIWAGIDPGLSGALCAYSCVEHRIVHVLDMPTEPWGKEKRHIDVRALVRWAHLHNVSVAVLERVNAMPSIPDETGHRRGMGAASAFRFGQCYGEVRAALVASGIRPIDTTPGSWKDLYELRGRPKDEARDVALKLWPNDAAIFRRKKDVGRAEAALIARHGVITARGR